MIAAVILLVTATGFLIKYIDLETEAGTDNGIGKYL